MRDAGSDGATKGADRAPDHMRVSAAAAYARPGLEGNRSDKLLRLFDFLLERSLQGQPPTEQQIADEVFSIGRTNAPRGDANVRVYVHRLRKILKDMPEPPGGDRLDLPVGSYMLRLAAQEAEEEVNIDEADSVAPERRTLVSRNVALRLFALLAITAVAGNAAWLALRPSEDARLASSMPWAAISGSDRPITVVMGDYYFFESLSESAEAAGAPKLVWDRRVPTREDLIIYQMLNPETASRVVDTNQHYVTSGTIAAAFAIRAALRRDAVFRQRALRLIPASQLTPELLKTTDVIYLGQLSGISAILRDPLVQASPFRLDDDLVSVTDMATGKQYRSDGVELRDEQISRRDYGYIARIPGPAGNNLILVAGLRDPGLKEMADLVIDTVRLAPLRSRVAHSPQGFEVLYQVRTLGSVNLGATVVLQRPIRTQGIWDRSASTPEYRPIAAPSGSPR
jgi:hypothetical protein